MSKVAIITGASGGLGSAVARRLATVGFAIAERRMTMKTDALTNPIIKTAIEA